MKLERMLFHIFFSISQLKELQPEESSCLFIAPQLAKFRNGMNVLSCTRTVLFLWRQGSICKYQWEWKQSDWRQGPRKQYLVTQFLWRARNLTMSLWEKSVIVINIIVMNSWYDKFPGEKVFKKPPYGFVFYSLNPGGLNSIYKTGKTYRDGPLQDG